MTTPDSPAQFDAFATDYDRALAEGISVSGEDKSYFARGRVRFLGRCLRKLREHPATIMDFGCGTGSGVPFLLELDGAKSVVGVDVSPASLDVARRTITDPRASFQTIDSFAPAGQFDLVFCNGVFHHIPPKDRPAAIAFIYKSLRKGGLFAFWENNPWNPGTRYVMSKIPFDADAITLSPIQGARTVRGGGFELLRRDAWFIFPKALKWLRPLEYLLMKLPLGTQYQVLGRKH